MKARCGAGSDGHEKAGARQGPNLKKQLVKT